IRDIRQGVKRDVSHGPDSRKCEQQHAGEDQKPVVRAPFNDSRDHDYIPPVAFTVICLLAIVCPFCCARMLTCQVPPEPRSPFPSYIPLPLSVALITVFIAAIPIAGIA